MVRRALRLPLQEPFRSGESVSFPYFLLKYKPNTLAHHRYAVVVGAKASPSSVVRHSIKRIVLGEAARWPPATSRGGYDMLYIISPRAGSLAKTELARALRSSLEKAKEMLFRSHP